MKSTTNARDKMALIKRLGTAFRMWVVGAAAATMCIAFLIFLFTAIISFKNYIGSPPKIAIHRANDTTTLDEGGIFLQNIAKCELETMHLGSEMADVFNSLVGTEGWAERLHQDFIAEHLGFATFMSKGLQNSGLTLTKSSSKQLQERGNWTGKSVNHSPYKVLNHKWVYMFGDSTTRQVWASFAAPFQGNNFERNSKEWTRQYVRIRIRIQSQSLSSPSFTCQCTHPVILLLISMS